MLLMLGTQLRADLLPNNFWVNPTFELGTNLDQTDGTVDNWNRGGGDPTICQVITNNSVSPTHALAVVDNNFSDEGYGEWYSDVTLPPNVGPGDTLDLQWYEMYFLDGPEMRLTILFFDAADAQVGGSTHFVTDGTISPGWVSSIEDSSFTQRNGSVVVPAGAVTMRCSLVSGGSGTITGVMVIDDLSVARAPVPNLLYGNFWPNPSFEIGTDLDQTTGTVSNWNRGGNSPTICQVITNNYTSLGHSLALIDTTEGDLYGEWYSDIPLAGNANPGDTLNLQWFEMYNLSGPEMRLTVLFFDSTDSVVGENHFVTSGTSNPGWVSTIEDSTFTRRNGSVSVPADAVKMRCSLVSGGSGTITGVMVIDDLSVVRVIPTVSGNFWVNSDFETGTDLDQTSGTPANWNRGGSDASIDQVTTNNYTSPTHALAVVDTDPNNYGEWYSDVSLSGHASPGDLLDVQWSEMYNIADGEMRVTVGFFDGSDNFITETHFVVTGDSPGWVSTVEDSSFTTSEHEVPVPANAARIRIALVSGGPSTTVGTMVIDDVTVTLHPPTVLSGNFFPNPTFENGTELDNPTAATPAGIWNRGGSDGSIDQVTTLNSVSPTHSLALVDSNENGYGEWYGFLNLVGLVTDGDVLDLQWYQLYDINNGDMRLSLAFLDAADNQLSNQDFNANGQSPGWTGTIADSPFERQFQRLEVPAGATQLRVNFASGGSSSVTGTMIIDDLSVRLSPLLITDVAAENGAVSITWNSAPNKTYTVQFTSDLTNPTWTPLITGWPSGGLISSYPDYDSHPGNMGFYRIVQE